jgi:uncharacterized protein YjiS (DUF1127 family)
MYASKRMSLAFGVGSTLPNSESALLMLGRAFRWVAWSVRSQLKIWRDERELHKLPDCLLKDIGISRCEIDYVVRNGR